MEVKFGENLKMGCTIHPSNYSINATPDGNYALRILEFYRELCNTQWIFEGESVMLEMMNKHQVMRAKELDEAIKCLKKCKNIVE